MKLKHYALLALALWLGVAVWVGAMILAKPRVQARFDDEDASAQLAQLQMGVERNRQLLGVLEGLERQPVGGGEALLAVQPASAAGQLSADGGFDQIAPRQLTLLLNTDGRRRALIDGQWVATGARLSDGSRVRAIGRDRVLLETAAGETLTVLMPPPFAPAPKAGGRP
ncbi:hypothetical protein P6166_12645 [Stenotrophomonas sp. HITSZ_GD]|uniref:hypothetical protein n=1 Tax=Stenotrophomonas sp. HITSZ_GD TaxID=3037248 RepID=UPI00240DC424|nr:hypothetical protein [Stenotrophomonas sp. HITSZ_GD]MDG2526204.1 hypothetical protein [Stenotrophomonas sp. HITSZ_GD]